MPLISSAVAQDYIDMYDGYDRQAVGLGMTNPNIYKSKSYAKKKVKKMLIGGISRITYAGWEHDREPLVMVLKYEPSYNTLLGFNLRYCPPQIRKGIMKFVLDSNAARIKDNLPILIDFDAMKRAVPDSQYIVRRYKVVGINVVETIHLNEWPDVMKEKSKWQGHYMLFKRKANESAKKKAKKAIKRKR